MNCSASEVAGAAVLGGVPLAVAVQTPTHAQSKERVRGGAVESRYVAVALLARKAGHLHVARVGKPNVVGKLMHLDPRDFLVTLEGTDQLNQVRARVGIQVVGSVAVLADDVSRKTERASLASQMAVPASESSIHDVQSVVESDGLLQRLDSPSVG